MTKYQLHDIVLYNCQGVMDAGIIESIFICLDNVLYTIRGVQIREDQVTAALGNATSFEDNHGEE